MDRIDTAKVIEQRIVNTKEGAAVMYVVEAPIDIVNDEVTISHQGYEYHTSVSDYGSRQGTVKVGLEYHRNPGRVGMMLNTPKSEFGVEFVAFQKDGSWYALGTWNNHGKVVIVE